LITIYGIKNCDKCRAAIKWFEQQDCEYRFHDLRIDGLDSKLLKRWTKKLTTTDLLNKRSATWRSISAASRELTSQTALQALMVDHPTLIKRPIIDNGNDVRLGYDEAEWQQLLA
jgi:Spx/MgsR family transcriptional regulator